MCSSVYFSVFKNLSSSLVYSSYKRLFVYTFSTLRTFIQQSRCHKLHCHRKNVLASFGSHFPLPTLRDYRHQDMLIFTVVPYFSFSFRTVLKCFWPHCCEPSQNLCQYQNKSRKVVVYILSKRMFLVSWNHRFRECFQFFFSPLRTCPRCTHYVL